MFAKSVFCGGGWPGRIALAAAVAAALSVTACGGSSGANQEEIARFQKKGAERVHEQERLRNLEKELKHIKHKGDEGSPAPPRNESPSVPPSTPAPAPTLESCGGELEVNSYTTCPFAEAVETEYFAEIGSGSGTVTAYSPVTETIYSMYCTSSPHECTGGNNAAVYFP